MASEQPLTPHVIVSNALPANGVLATGCYAGRSAGTTSQLSTPPVPAAGTVQPFVQVEEEGIDCSPCCSNDTLRHTFRNIVYGQILSLCLCGTGVGSQLLSDRGINTPAAQSFLNYFLLSSVYGTVLACRKGDGAFLAVLRRRGWRYLLLSLLDVEANYAIVYAYQFTNLTSVQLLDCSTIPMVLLLSWLFLSTRYLLSHILGVGMCLVGIAVLIWADALEGKGASGGSNRVLGDVLCLAGSMLYAVGNVAEEFSVKQNSRVEYLGMLGLFGSIISGVQLAALEHRELASVNWSGPVVALYLLFALCMFLFYSLVSVLVQKSSALMFNLSILTADFYTLLFGLLLFKYEFHALYFVSFAIVLLGSVVYSSRETERRDADEPRNLCCLLCRCSAACANADDRSSNIPQAFFTSPIAAAGSGSGVALANSSLVSASCPVHGRQVPLQPIETYT